MNCVYDTVGAKAMVSQFLVYGLVDPRTNELRYVGKSATGMKRPQAHMNRFELSKDTHKTRWIKTVLADGVKPIILVLRECESEVQAYAYEVMYIALFKQAGFSLTNSSEGGKGGNKGRKFTEEQRAKCRKAQTARWAGKPRAPKPAPKYTKLSPEELHRVRSENARRLLGNAATKAKATAAKQTAEFKLKQAEVTKEMWDNPDYKGHMVAVHRGHIHTAEHKAKISNSLYAFYDTVKNKSEVVGSTEDAGHTAKLQESGNDQP